MKGDASFLVELGFLLILLGAAGALALRVGLSTAPLFLLAGLLIAEGGPVSLTSAEPFLEAAAAVGVVLLLLALGLEFSADEFGNALKRHAPSGVVDFFLNATPGFIFGWLIGLEWPACLALAGITWVSSSGIVAKVLSDLNRLGNRETPAVLSVLVLGAVAAAFAIVSVGIATFVGPKRANRAKLDAYECGIEPLPQDRAVQRIPVKYYLTAMLFIIFDIEIVFLYPWAVAFDNLGTFALVEMLIFMATVFVAYGYVWRRGGLEWD